MRMSADGIRRLKGARRISAVTAYDHSMAVLLGRAGVDILLVGDSAGMVMLGHEGTERVTMPQMCTFTSAVASAQASSLVVADMPFMSYQPSADEAVRNAGRLVAAGARAVKLEGGAEAAGAVRRIAGAGIPVMGHIGLQPQTGMLAGGSLRRGTDSESAAALAADARSLEDAGVFAITLEMVGARAAGEITRSVGVPTIGIGSGPECDGQVLVAHDMLGMYTREAPSFAKRYAELGAEITAAVAAFKDDVEAGRFPAAEHTFGGGRS